MSDKMETDPVASDQPEDITGDGGVLKRLITEGTGWERPASGADVEVHYTGTLHTDGTKFDSSVDRGEPFKFKLGEKQVIKGWEEAVATMRKGEKAKFTLAPQYAYGVQGSPPKIPPNATLDFEIELLSWADEKDLSKAKDGSIMTKPIKSGEGWEHPKPEASVRVQLRGVVMKSETEEGDVFLNTGDTPVEFVVGDGTQPKGVDKAVRGMKKSEQLRVTCKPSAAYGDAGLPAQGVAPGATVRFYITLVDFSKLKESYQMSNEEKLQEATDRRQKGNDLYKAGNYKRAYRMYKSALDCVEYDHTFKDDKHLAAAARLPIHLNIAMTYLKLQKPKEAIEQANKALAIDSKNAKALLRRAQARIIQGDYGEARADLARAAEYDSTSRDIMVEQARLKKLQAAQDEKDRAMYSKMFQ